uniref:uncharacterized protein LOC122605253 n=1 Tax=Erigeron canadensis TaxID=72917 RepID=UPI001CB8EADE|nr:uncharacterized protein LOC122605253 [Erigeron canadensis]XP_043634098.1 uncharacterized protein LOC122605253 [Erigeron canadensis]
MFGSRLWINDDLPAISEFKDRLLAVNAEVNANNRVLSSNMVYSNPRDYWMKWEVKTIDEIADINTVTGCVVVGTIISIQAENGWYYLACHKCSKKVERVFTALDGIPKSKFECGECGVVTDVYGRIKLQVRVQDGTGTVFFILFQKDVTDFIGKKATDLLSKINQEDDFELFPEDFNMFINKRFAFKIKVSDYNLKHNYRVYTVNKLSVDEGIINSVLELIPMLEDIPDIPRDADVKIESIESKAALSKDAVSVTGDTTTPNELLKSTASSPGTKRKNEDAGDETHVMFKASSSKNRPDISTLKIPKMEKL